MRRQTLTRTAVAVALGLTALLGLSAGTASAATARPAICTHVDCYYP